VKRSEIKVGEAYYYDRSNDWATPRFGAGTRVVVVDDKRYRANDPLWGRRSQPYSQDPRGTLVLVDIYRDGNDGPSRDVVPLAHLRGPWESTSASVNAWKEQRNAEREAATERADDLRDRARAAVERAGMAGFKARVHGAYGGDDPDVRMSVDEFERLVERIEGGV
jgi:hypothetical protein